jgi:hypothetical protein
MPKVIKTIKITSILAACAALLFVALPALSGNDSKKNENPTNSDSIIERYKRLREQKSGSESDQTPPLIKQARDFALYLNPPPPPKPPEIKQEPGTPGIPNISAGPSISSARFTLIATCVNKTNPESSLALIEEPGQDRRWVRPAATIGHLTVKEILDAKIVMLDGSRQFQVDMTKTQAEISLLTNILGQPTNNIPENKSSMINTGRNLTTSSTAGRNVVTPATATSNRPVTTPKTDTIQTPALTPQQEKVLQKFMDEIGTIITNAGDDEESLQKSFQQSDEIIDKYFKQMDNMHIDQNESNDINDLGKLLEDFKDSNNITLTPAK